MHDLLTIYFLGIRLTESTVAESLMHPQTEDVGSTPDHHLHSAQLYLYREETVLEEEEYLPM